MLHFGNASAQYSAFDFNFLLNLSNIGLSVLVLSNSLFFFPMLVYRPDWVGTNSALIQKHQCNLKSTKFNSTQRNKFSRIAIEELEFLPSIHTLYPRL